MPYMNDSPPVEDVALEPIAICGMGCRLPGQVDSPSSLWEMLMKKGTGQSDKVPKSRFNIDAHFHKNLERPGSFNVRGGYFIDGPAESFDPTFFNMTPVEAMWLDPQQRKMLEVCYEAIESAGLTLDSVSGSNTAVFVGSFTADYQQMTFRDPDFRHSYAATGVDPGIISNRIGNVFDLRGPSFTINTACSSSVYAVHNACHALRARDCEAALVGGVNLILTVDQHMNTAKLGVLSPTSFCHTFDASADGYGRGEGAGALYLKRLSDAVRDGDVIRAAIRSSAVNTNGKVPGYGITYPNVKGQEMVIRLAYKRANLDPNKTAYFECHGTGTPVGDPIEVRAVSNAMNDSRALEKPLIIGAVKPNIGHSEAASGIFAIMKAAMMTESGIIPGVAGLKTVNPEIPEAALNVKVNKDTSLWPQGFDLRRASVSSFGYGGTNGHVVVEDIRSLVPHYQHGTRKNLALYDHSSSRPLLVTFSAHDKTTLVRNIEAHVRVVNQYYLSDFAHTLNLKRSRFPQRAFTIASENTAAEDMSLADFKFGSITKQISQVAFIFTGQGAQWAGVGKDAIKTFPIFRETIRKLDRVLKGLEHRPKFSIEEELIAPPETSNINNANVSQPTLVATQIAIVDLLSSWNIVPVATVGHSAGEYAAAYAAGIASAPEIIIAAYYRGYALENYAPSGGTMLAVGKGLDEVAPYASRFNEDIVVACENSPNSVTLSGTIVAIQEAKSMFDAESTFARELKTGMAYHSPQMKTVAGPMVELVKRAHQKLDSFHRQWRCPRRVMISSVTSAPVADGQLDADYWASNLTSRVLFNTAVSTLVTTAGLENIGGFIEIGPHSALAGPFKQICQANAFNSFSYIPTLLRNQDGAKNLLRTVGELFLADYPVDMYRVNQLETSGDATDLKGSGKLPLTLVDLPPYQWNYERMFWAEPRMSAEYRQPSHARHDLLGSKIPGLSDRSMVWRNILRLKDIPWLQDHKLGGSVMFPAAGHMALAIEAARQHCEIKDIDPIGMTLRNVELKTALIIPENDAGLEIQVRLSQTSVSPESVPSYNFGVESYSNGAWTVHSEGAIVPVTASQEFVTRPTNPVNQDVLSQRHTGKRWNDTFRRVGFEYGPSFASLDKIRTHEKYFQAAGQIPIATTSNLMADESRYMLHPSSVDCLLQLCIISIHAGLYQEMPWGVVPIKFEEVTVLPPGDDADTIGQAVSWNNVRGDRARYFNTDSQLATQAGKVVLDIKGLHTVAYEAALPPRSESQMKPLPYAGVVWKPDLAICRLEDALSPSAKGGPAISAVPEVVGLLSHKRPLSSVLVVNPPINLDISQMLQGLPTTTDMYVAHDALHNVEDGTWAKDERVNSLTLPEGPLDLNSLSLESQDMVIVGHKDAPYLVNSEALSSLKLLLGANGKAIYLLNHDILLQAREEIQKSGFSSTEIAFQDQTLVLCSLVAFANGSAQGPDVVNLVFSRQHSAAPQALADAMANQGLNVLIKEIESVNLATDKQIVFYNPSGNLLAQPEPATFQAVKEIVPSGASILWLTAGVNEGKCTSGAMIQGFLRVVREEQKMSKLSLLDFDKSETFVSVAKTVCAILGPNSHTASTMKHEYWLHNGACHVSRVVPNEDINVRMVTNDEAIQVMPLPSQQLLRATLNGSDVTFSRSDALERRLIESTEVEIQIDCVEFHKQDLQTEVYGPRLVSGTVLNVGTAIDSGLRGKTVVAYVSNPYDTIVRVAEVMCIECEPSGAKALVHALPDICRAVNAMQCITGPAKKQHVILLPTSGPMVQSFVRLSEAQGFKLTVVRDQRGDTDKTMDSVSINSRSVYDTSEIAQIRRLVADANTPMTVIAQDFSPFSQEIWRSIPSSGCFVLSENKQGSLSAAPDVAPFNRGARFCATSIASNFEADPHSLGKTLQTTVSTMKDQLGAFANVASVVGIKTLSEASQSATDRSILVYNYESDIVKVVQSKQQLRFSSEDTYLLVGCLGGLGRSLTSWMMDRGAKHFAFISRSAADKPEAAQLIKSITEAGAIPQVFRGDASNISDVSSVIKAVTSERRIKGVVHAAMVLEDGMLGAKMTLDKFTAALVPKVDGAQALHNALKGHDLDFFVMTSSISATIGQPGQSNYAAANSFLDNLAWQRNLMGLPATSLVLPMVLGVGVVAENDSLEDKITRRGMYGIDEREMLRGFEAAMSQPIPNPNSGIEPKQCNSTIILGLEPSRLATALAAAGENTDIAWYEDMRFSNLRPLIDAATGQSGKGGGKSGAGGDFAEQAITAASKDGYDTALKMTATYIMQKCASILMTPVEDFALEGQSIGGYGLDSMIGAELRNWLFKEFGLNIAFQDLLATTLTFRGLSGLVLAGLGVGV